MRDPAYLAEEAVEPARRAPAPPPVPGRVTTTTRLFPGALFRKARDANGVAAGAEDAVARAGSSGGAPLPGDVRGRFEQSLGADLSGVRVHTGAASADAAGAVGARAYALGNDIHFADGQYAPTDPFGLHLLAHEVAHTQQQAGSAARPQYKLEVSAPGDAAELEADRAADAMVAGTAAHVGSSVAGVARAGDPAAKAQAPAQAPTFVEFTTDGAWDAAHVLDQLGTLTSVPDDLKTAIQNGPKAAATFCVGLRERVTASDAADKATIASALTSRINELANATPQSPLQYGQLADVARWAAQHPPNAAPAAAAAAAPAAAGPGQAAAPEQTEGDKFRQQFLQSAQPGQAIMSQDDIDAANASHEGKGKVTTCILYAGDKYNAAIAGKQGAAKFLGPNAYKEANPAADLSAKTALPPGSWRDASDGMSERPKPGDMLVLDYAEATAIGDGDKKVMAQRGWFAHIDILQSIKAGEGDKPGEVWTTVDGGSTSSTQGDHQYDPATRTLTDRFGKRLLKGWFDVEKMAGVLTMSKTGERDEDLVEAARPAASHAPGRGTTTARLFPGALLRKARAARDANGVAPGAGDAVARASSSGGTPLPGDVRGRFEQSLGADLSGVRVHTGGASEDAASAVGARAYTTGSDIHFGAGQYAPADPFGLHLLAHEVAHTHQQGGAQVSRGVGADGWNDQYKSPGSGNLDAHSGSYDNYKKFLASTGETRATSGVGGHKIEGDVTSAELLEIFPGIADDQQNGKVTQDQIDAMLGELNGAFRTMKIDTVEAQASYFGNAFCESNQFRNMTETALSDQDKYQTEPSKLHLDDGWLDDAAAGKKKDVAGYQQGGKIHAQNGEGWDKSFIGRGATQVTFRDYYIQCIAILEKRAAELDKEDPDGDDTKAIHDAITNIKADPAQAGNPKYAFLFSAAHLKMPINQQGTTADESVTKGASGTSYMGPQTSTLPLKEQANRHATEVLMRRAQHQAEQAQQGDPPAATDSAEAVPGGVAEKVQRAADPGAAADTGAASGLDVSHPGDAAEVEADRMADAMVAGAPSAGASASASGVSRAPDPAAGAADASGDAAAIVACADKERAQEPPVPAETTLRGAEIASRLLSGYLPELAATWWVSGTAGSASVTGVKLEPQDGKNVSVTIGRDFILRTEQATLGERAEELRAAFRALESARAKQLLSPDQLAEASKRNEERVKRQEVSYNELQFAVGAPLTFPRGIAQNGVTGASQQGQTWADALGPASLAIAEKQQALGLAVDGKAEDATLQALGFVKNGKHWARAKAPDWKAVDAAESQTVADQKATAQKVGADTNESVDGRRSSIVSFARQQIGTVDASDRGDGKKYGNVRVVDIYRTLGLLKDGDTSKRGDLEAANKVANDTYGANLAARDKAVHDPDHDHDPKPKPLSHDEQSQLAIYQQTGKVGDWSWCGLFAVYCVKAATGVGGWTGNGATGYAAFSTGGDLEKFKQANPQPGDVLHIISHNQHHALLAEPPGADGMGPLSTVEGNVEAQGIRESQRFTFANVDIVYKPFK